MYRIVALIYFCCSQILCAQTLDLTKEYTLNSNKKLAHYISKINTCYLVDDSLAVEFLTLAYKEIDTNNTFDIILYNYWYCVVNEDNRYSDSFKEMANKGLQLSNQKQYTYYQGCFHNLLGNSYAFKNNTIALNHYSLAYNYLKQSDDIQKQLYLLLSIYNLPVNHKDKPGIEQSIRRLIKLIKSDIKPSYLPFYYDIKSLIDTTEQEAIANLDSSFYYSENKEREYKLRILTRKANVYKKFKNYNKAESYLLEVIKLAEKQNASFFTFSNYLRLSDIYFKKREFEKSQIYFEKYITQSIPKQSYINVNKLGYQLYKNLNNNKKALEYLELYNSDIQEENNNNIDSLYIDLNTKYNNDILSLQLSLKNSELTLSNRSRTLTFIITLLIILILTIFFYLKNKNKNERIALGEEMLNKEQEINSFRKLFIENISHEMRTPMSLIKGSIDIWRHNLYNNLDTEDVLNIAEQNIYKLNNDFEYLLSLANKDSAKMNSSIEHIHLIEFFNSIIHSYKINCQSKGIQLIYKHNFTADSVCYSDCVKLRVVLNNLISNAIKFSNQSSSIIVETIYSYRSTELCIQVKDFGIGIPIEDQKKIFQRFNQASNSKSGGFGIGLSIVNDIAQDLNAKVSVDSIENEYCIFQFILNTKISNYTTHIHSNQLNFALPIEVKKDSNKPNILIADDNELMIHYYGLILTPYYNCDFTFNGEEAFEKLKANKYDCILLDIMMPKLNGLELTALLLEFPKTKNTPIIIVSANNSEESKIKGFNQGIHDFINKPFIIDELLARINNVLLNSKERVVFIEKIIHNEPEIPNSEEPISIEYDEKQLLKLNRMISQNISNQSLRISDIADEMSFSNSTLFRFVKRKTGLTPVKYVLELRLKKAYQLLKNRTYPTLLEVQLEIGIKSSAHFNKTFKARFGISPSQLFKSNIATAEENNNSTTNKPL